MEAKKEEPRKEITIKTSSERKIIDLSEISLSLDGYDDLFSDFDPRPSGQRALSEDFLAEAKRASLDKPGGSLKLKFLVPKNMRKISEESVIKNRLREHFRHHHKLLSEESSRITRMGFMFAILGIILMFIATLVLFNFGDGNLLASFTVVLLEPAGWYLLWEGMNLIIFRAKERKIELEFYKNMSRAEIQFLSY